MEHPDRPVPWQSNFRLPVRITSEQLAVVIECHVIAISHAGTDELECLSSRVGAADPSGRGAKHRCPELATRVGQRRQETVFPQGPWNPAILLFRRSAFITAD